jgi:hypothetical protein
MIEVDAIFCQSFGLREDGPGTSNQALAEAIIKIHGELSKPPKLIIQKNCADAFPEGFKIDKIILEHSNPGKYLDSYEVSRQCAEYCFRNGIKKLLVFAHPDHLWRVRKTIEKFEFDCLGVTSPVPYDKKSSQIWTRSKWLFLPREMIVNLIYFLTGKI